MVGYASTAAPGAGAAEELERQRAAIAQESQRRGLVVREVVREREPTNGKALGRPGLDYAMGLIRAGQANGLLVSDLSRLTRSAAELGRVLASLHQSNARLVAAEQNLDTEESDGRLAADLLIEVSCWERARLSERTRSALQAAKRDGRSTGRPAVGDDPQLKERIVKMRAHGITLQAIADQLNAENVPTVRGGTRWRHSSVQAVLGYRRRARAAAYE